MSASNLPPLPKIDGDPDIMLDIYMHRSLGIDSNNTEYGNADRLRYIGESVLRVVVMTHVFSQRPMLNVEQMTHDGQSHLSSESLTRWVDSYNLRAKVRVGPGVDINSSAISTEFMHTFIGALYVRNGLQAVQNWISKLISPDAQPPQPPVTNGGAHIGEDNPPNYHNNQNHFASSPPPPSHEPPPLPGQPQFGATSYRITLAMMNQTAAQRGFQVTYPTVSQGPPHAPVWNATCCVNGVEYGRGTGKTQKSAKEEAAEIAWRALGW